MEDKVFTHERSLAWRETAMGEEPMECIIDLSCIYTIPHICHRSFDLQTHETRQVWRGETLLPWSVGNGSLNENLLLLLQRLDKVHRHVQSLGSHLGGRQSEPLRQRNIGDSVRFVDLNPDQVLILGGILDVVPRVVGENGRVAWGKVECPGVAIAGEDGRPGAPGVEVEPLLRLGTDD